MKDGVRKMTAADIEAVARLHRECFPSSRSTLLGQPFVRAMYGWFLANQSDLAVVYEKEGTVVGVLTGAVGGFGRRLFRATWPTVLWGLLVNPRLWFNPRTFRLWRSYLVGLQPWRYRSIQHKTPAAAKMQASVAGIAVSTGFRGNGIAQALLSDFESRSKCVGAVCLSLTVESDNVAAHRAYERAGWTLVRKDPNGFLYEKPLA
jgi:ribosomal protein S18 acetylase RimI-like enzyme